MRRSVVRTVTSVVVMAAASLAMPGASVGADQPTLAFRGSGATRTALNELQLKPFDQALWGTLTDWTGEPIKPEQLEGKPVLIVTWAHWLRASWPAMRQAQGLYEKYKDQGLVVVGVHNPRGGNGAADNLKFLGVTFPVAWDSKGEFRTALRADQDPNIYLIDRSGNLRYAQVETASMAEAVGFLVKETADEARDVPGSLAAKKQAAEAARWKTSGVGNELEPGRFVEVKFPEPDEEAYKNASWPFLVGKVEQDKILERIHNDPPKLQLSEAPEDWIPTRPPLAGRVWVTYFFDPKDSDMLNVIPTMNRLQVAYRSDVYVIGSMTKFGSELMKSQRSPEEEAKYKQRNLELLKTLKATREINHVLTPYELKAENLEFTEGSMRVRLSRQREQWGVAAIISTDGKIRWIGNPYSQDLRNALDKIIAVDPGVQARRVAEVKKRLSGGKDGGDE